MRTVTDNYTKMMARLNYRASFDFRVIDQDGKVWTIPPKAITNRSRGGRLDDWTWKLGLTIHKDRLPKGVTIQQYHTLEVLRLIPGEEPKPYFKGIIDKVSPSSKIGEGNLLAVEAFGVLQRTKKYRLNRFNFTPGTTGGAAKKLVGVCSTQRVSVSLTKGAGDKERIPAFTTYQSTGSSPRLKISANSDMSSPYVLGTNYTAAVDSEGFVEITWITDPADTRYFEFAKVDRFAYMPWDWTSGLSKPAWFVCPYGRDPSDTFSTFIDAFDGTARTITPVDPTGYKSLLDLTQQEVLKIVTASGITFVKISSVDANGVLTIDAGTALPSDLEVGCAISLATTEHYQAWDETAQIVFKTASSGTKYNPRWFQVIPNGGFTVPLKNKDWQATDEVWCEVYAVLQSEQNRADFLLKYILATSTGLFSTSDVTTEPINVYLKNYYRAGVDLDSVLNEWKEEALPPNAFIHDNPDGTVSIKPYTQKNTHDWALRGVQSIEVIDEPEPVTAVTVISKGEEKNLAPEYFMGAYQVTTGGVMSNLPDASRVIDNSTATAATPAAGSRILIYFKIKPPQTETMMPHIDKVRITGRGLLNVYAFVSTSNRYVAGYTNKPIGYTGAETIEIPGEALIPVLSTTTERRFYVGIDPLDMDGSTIAPEVYEVEIQTTKHNAWKAQLTDQTSTSESAYSIANNGADALGSVWVQSDTTKRQSWRYAPSSILKRMSSKYTSVGSQVPRYLVLELKGITAQDCRDYAERYLDEGLRAATRYRVVAPLDDRAEFGDTVLVRHPETGESPRLFLWGIDDGGAIGDVMATYEMVDYGV